MVLFLECVGEAVEAAFDGAIENVVTDLNAQAAEEFGGDFVFEGQVLAVLGDDRIRSAGPLLKIEWGGALDDGVLALHFEANQALQGHQDALVIARFGGDQFGDSTAHVGLIERATGHAHAKDAVGGGFGDFGNFHGEIKD